MNFIIFCNAVVTTILMQQAQKDKKKDPDKPSLF